MFNPGLAQWMLAGTFLIAGFAWGWASHRAYLRNVQQKQAERRWRASHWRWFDNHHRELHHGEQRATSQRTVKEELPN